MYRDMFEELQKIHKFLTFSENLKKEIRHSWLSDGRPESVAEHVWRTSLMAMLFAPHLEERVDIEKVLKMIIIHDIVEAEAGDMPSFIAEEGGRKAEKEENERRAIENIRIMLDNFTGNEIYDLWYEFEEQTSPEAKFAVALDKLEATLQHNEADIGTWLQIEKERILYKLDPYCEYDKFLRGFAGLLKEQALEKMIQAGVDIEAIKEKAARYQISSLQPEKKQDDSQNDRDFPSLSGQIPPL